MFLEAETVLNRSGVQKSTYGENVDVKTSTDEEAKIKSLNHTLVEMLKKSYETFE